MKKYIVRCSFLLIAIAFLSQNLHAQDKVMLRKNNAVGVYPLSVTFKYSHGDFAYTAFGIGGLYERKISKRGKIRFIMPVKLYLRKMTINDTPVIAPGFEFEPGFKFIVASISRFADFGLGTSLYYQHSEVDKMVDYQFEDGGRYGNNYGTLHFYEQNHYLGVYAKLYLDFNIYKNLKLGLELAYGQNIASSVEQPDDSYVFKASRGAAYTFGLNFAYEF